MNIVKEIIVELVKTLPLSLIVKFSDGRLTTQEIIELSREVAMIAFKVIHDQYGEGDDVDEVAIKKELFG